MKMNKKQQGRGESYLERWRLLAAKEAAGVVFAPFLLLFLCFLLRCFFCFCYLPLFSARRYWWLWRGRATVALPGWRWPAMVLLLPPLLLLPWFSFSRFCFVSLLFYLASVFYSFLPSLVLLPFLSLPFSPSPKFCPSRFLLPILFFPACIYRQLGERFAIPCSSAGHGSPSHFSSIMLAGYGCVGMGHAGFLDKWGEVREQEKWFKIIFFPASACAGKKENSAVQNGTVSVFCFFFFLRKEKCNLEEPKNGLW